ncbi:MAG TPA: sensor histidine kinase, partial [Tepidisphaeraceae bacterium]|nr:sensor histidine kinase [Tepidisphaeraceae bacterium]
MEQPPLDNLQNQRLPEAAASLRAAKAQILSRWREEVTSILPQWDALTRKQLEDSLPDLLDRIAAALESDRPAPLQQLIAMAPNHGSTRYHQEFSLNQLLIEYHALRRIMLEEMSRVLKRPLSTVENVALNQGVDVAVRQSSVEFAEQQATALKIEASAMAKFLSFLSHDLRGGLNGAVLMIEVLKRELEGHEDLSESAEDLDTLRRTMLDTVATMERFLNAEKLRHGGMPIKMAPLDVAEMLGEFQKAFAYPLRDQQMEMEIDVQPPGLIISSDKQLLMMVLQNLISNAIKYGRRGKVKATATGALRAPTGLSCRLAISDSGRGIPPEMLADMFSQFQRGETYGQKGVGLGLFIARQAADLLRAKLWADSKPGEGSTF